MCYDATASRQKPKHLKSKTPRRRHQTGKKFFEAVNIFLVITIAGIGSLAILLMGPFYQSQSRLVKIGNTRISNEQKWQVDSTAEISEEVANEEVVEQYIESEDSYNQKVETEIMNQLEEEQIQQQEEEIPVASSNTTTTSEEEIVISSSSISSDSSKSENSSAVMENSTESQNDNSLIDETNSFVSSNSELSEDDFELLAKVTFAESGNQTYEQQIAVAAVILNRMNFSQFPNTLKGVVTQEGQFSTVKNGIVYAYGEPVIYSTIPEETISAVRAAIAGEDPTEEFLRDEANRIGITDSNYWSGGALYFYNPEYCSSEQNSLRSNIKVKVQFGNHIFYKIW